MARLQIDINLKHNIDKRHEVNVSQINDVGSNELLQSKDLNREELGKLMNKLIGYDIDNIRKATKLFQGTSISIQEK